MGAGPLFAGSWPDTGSAANSAADAIDNMMAFMFRLLLVRKATCEPAWGSVLRPETVSCFSRTHIRSIILSGNAPRSHRSLETAAGRAADRGLPGMRI